MIVAYSVFLMALLNRQKERHADYSKEDVS